nr:hypothetical protein [Halomonas endophytica]
MITGHGNVFSINGFCHGHTTGQSHGRCTGEKNGLPCGLALSANGLGSHLPKAQGVVEDEAVGVVHGISRLSARLMSALLYRYVMSAVQRAAYPHREVSQPNLSTTRQASPHITGQEAELIAHARL